MNSATSNIQRLKYHRFTPSDCEDKEIRKFEFLENLSSFLSD